MSLLLNLNVFHNSYCLYWWLWTGKCFAGPHWVNWHSPFGGKITVAIYRNLPDLKQNIWCFVWFGVFCTILRNVKNTHGGALFLKVTLLDGFFLVFWNVQMVPNRAIRLMLKFNITNPMDDFHYLHYFHYLKWNFLLTLLKDLTQTFTW